MADYLCLQKVFSSLSKCPAHCSGIPGSFPSTAQPNIFWNCFQTTAAQLELSYWGSVSPIATAPFLSSPFGQPVLMLSGKGWCWLQRACSHHLASKASSFASYTIRYANSSYLSFGLTTSNCKSSGRKRSTPPAKQGRGRASHVNLI